IIFKKAYEGWTEWEIAVATTIVFVIVQFNYGSKTLSLFASSAVLIAANYVTNQLLFTWKQLYILLVFGALILLL
ncbi:hypothetical protein PMAYCL1PPCAC_21334, partial [Pristionchus mayeri]